MTTGSRWPRLDWGWLLGIGVLKPFAVADQIGLPLSAPAAGLRERLIALGHVRDEESFRLSWALIRLVLHRGDPDLTAITDDDVEEMRQVIKHLDQVPGIGEVIDLTRLPGLRAAWGTNAYRAGLALFHGGITGRVPVPYRGLPRPPLSSKPRIAAVMDRFVAERALVLRPDSMTSLRGGQAPGQGRRIEDTMSHDKIRAAARQRMEETGEPYAAARRAVVTEHQGGGQIPSPAAGYAFAMSGEIHDWLADLRGSNPLDARCSAVRPVTSMKSLTLYLRHQYIGQHG